MDQPGGGSGYTKNRQKLLLLTTVRKNNQMRIIFYSTFNEIMQVDLYVNTREHLCLIKNKGWRFCSLLRFLGSPEQTEGTCFVPFFRTLFMLLFRLRSNLTHLVRSQFYYRRRIDQATNFLAPMSNLVVFSN